jgi:hypothetical protein
VLEAGDTPRSHPLVERLLEQGYTPTEVAAAILRHFAPPAAMPATADAELFPADDRRRPPAGKHRGKGPRPRHAHDRKPAGKPRKFGPRKRRPERKRCQELFRPPSPNGRQLQEKGS